MSYSDHLKMKVYVIEKGNLDNFVRFEQTERNADNINSLLQAYRCLWEYLKGDLNIVVLEIWQAPIPFSRGLGYATLFRLNPYDQAYLVSPVRMEWLEGEKKEP